MVAQAFQRFSDGSFADGLCLLAADSRWEDNVPEIGDGPFCLRFPGAKGWGESLLLASLLKRHAKNEERTISVSAEPQVQTLLAHDPCFTGQANDIGYRSPLSILQASLIGDLLELPFEPIQIGANSCPATLPTQRIGIAWASIGTNPIAEKSIPIDQFLKVFDGYNGSVVSFQRHIPSHDRASLDARFRDSITYCDDAELHRDDQLPIARKIAKLDCMVTVSTTTAHMAASMGVPVLLLAAKRKGPQWFWRAQEEHGKVFYPSVRVILGQDGDKWWSGCISLAQEKLGAVLARG